MNNYKKIIWVLLLSCSFSMGYSDCNDDCGEEQRIVHVGIIKSVQFKSSIWSDLTLDSEKRIVTFEDGLIIKFDATWVPEKLYIGKKYKAYYNQFHCLCLKKVR